MISFAPEVGFLLQRAAPDLRVLLIVRLGIPVARFILGILTWPIVDRLIIYLRCGVVKCL